MKIFLILMFITFSVKGICQSKSKDYYIFSLHVDYKKAFHRGNTYLWIIAKDSLGTNSVAPLYLNGFTKTAYSQCMNGASPRLFMLTQSDEWDFTDKQVQLHNNIEAAIKSSTKKIATIDIKGKGYREVITIEVVLVKGQFCECPINNDESKLIDYLGNIYLPFSEITILPINVDELNISDIIKSLPISQARNATN